MSGAREYAGICPFNAGELSKYKTLRLQLDKYQLDKT